MTKKNLLIVTILLISVRSLFAVPAVPWIVDKIQPDGTVISVYLKGDENVHWMESTDGSYDEVTVTAVDGVINSISPNPCTQQPAHRVRTFG